MRKDSPTKFMDLALELQKIYESEINVRIGWLWDGGIEVRLGDEANGFLAEENVHSVADIVPWLQKTIAHLYPNSTYAKGRPPELIEKAATALFLVKSDQVDRGGKPDPGIDSRPISLFRERLARGSKSMDANMEPQT